MVKLCRTHKMQCDKVVFLATNIVASLRGRPTKHYRHHNLGTIATLGMGRGAFQSGRIGFTGFPAWLIHRVYHLYAVPTWERKVRVLSGWLATLRFGRDIVSVEDARHPRAAFVQGGIPQRHSVVIATRAPRTRWLTLHAPIDRRLRHPRALTLSFLRLSVSHEGDCSSCS